MRLFSDRWHRVATLRPRLVAQLRMRRQRVRGETWYVLADEAGAGSCRLNRAAYELAARLDGHRSVEMIWEARQARTERDAPTQDETIDLLVRLRDAGLIDLDRPADFALLLPHLAEQRPAHRRFGLLAWRLPLVDPSRLLDRLVPLTRWAVTRAALVAWSIAAAILLILALRHGPALWAHAEAWLGTPRYLFLATCLYPPIKLLHELAHGLVLRQFGAPVREAGITLLLFCMPVPYVDASASAAFPRARERIAVAAAGIMVELLIALGGLMLWLSFDAGWLRDAGFVAFVIGSVSTVLLNANPLQRFDGYYLLVDALGLPNLGPRSRAWWQQALARRLLALRDAEPMPLAHGERPWLIAYAPLSWVWQLGVGLAISAWLAGVSLVLGVIAIAAVAVQGLLRPMARLWVELARQAPREQASSRRLRRVAIGAALAALALLLVPLPQGIVAPGVLWPPEAAQLRADTEGLVRALRRRDGDAVSAGELLLELDNPALAARAEVQAARVAALQSETVQAQLAHAAVGDSRAELERAQAELARTRERLDSLQIHAHRAGRLVLPRGADLVGSYLRQGTLVGHVQDGRGPVLRVALAQSDAAELHEQAGAAGAWLGDGRGRALAGTLLRDAFAASNQLPSAALGTRHGGALQTDPADKDGLRTLRPIVLVDIALADAPDAAIGLRGWVRIDQGHAPAAWQALRWLRQELHRRFDAHR